MRLQVAQDTWRSMTGVPLRDERGMYSDPTVARSVDSRREDIRRASLQVAGGYAAQARQAQAGAIAAQRQMDSMAYQALNTCPLPSLTQPGARRVSNLGET